MIDPISENYSIDKKVLDGPTAGINQAVSALKKWIASQLVGSVHHSSLSALRQRQNELGCEVGKTWAILGEFSHERCAIPIPPLTRASLPASHESSSPSCASIRAYCDANESSRREDPRAHASKAG